MIHTASRGLSGVCTPCSTGKYTGVRVYMYAHVVWPWRSISLLACSLKREDQTRIAQSDIFLITTLRSAEHCHLCWLRVQIVLGEKCACLSHLCETDRRSIWKPHPTWDGEKAGRRDGRQRRGRRRRLRGRRGGCGRRAGRRGGCGRRAGRVAAQRPGRTEGEVAATQGPTQLWGELSRFQNREMKERGFVCLVSRAGLCSSTEAPGEATNSL